ncbi:MAG: hypothetical protein ACJAV5_002030 [Vicingaceae bacterium]|jgi:uncharacterized protein (DUF2141 family)
MKKIVIGAFFFALFGFSTPTEKHKLSIKVEGITEIKGNLGILLFNSEDGYPEAGKRALRSYTIKVESESMIIELGEFPTGEYAVTLMQDKNMNGIMDKNMIGIPKEPFGFTKLQEIPFGPPSFRESSIKLVKSTIERIKLMEI